MTTVALDWRQRPTKRSTPTDGVLAPVFTLPGADGSGYARAALQDELTELARATPGTRNHRLNQAAFSMAQLVAAGLLDRDVTTAALRSVARQIGLDDAEIGATVASGFRAGLTQPREVVITGGMDAPAVEYVDVADLLPGAEGDPAEVVELSRTSWWAEPLTAQAAGADAAPPPTHLWRSDGKALLYSGKVNGLLGESESGKSWVMLKAIADALLGGERALLLDFEDAPAGILARLTSMGVDADALENLDYAGPDSALTAEAGRDLAETLTNGYSIIGFDGVNAAMTLLGLDINSNTDATAFYMRVLRPLARTGACVVTVDHLPKNAEQRGKGGIGAQAKRAMMDGAALSVEILSPFGEGRSGTLKIKVDKDRPGKVRGIATGGVHVALVKIISTPGHVEMSVHPPAGASDDGGAPAPFRPTKIMENASKMIERSPEEPTMGAISRALASRKDFVVTAVELLVAEGYVEQVDGPRNAKMHRHLKPYRPAEDPKSDVYTGPVPTRSDPFPGTAQTTRSASPLPFGGRNGSGTGAGPAQGNDHGNGS